MRFLGLVLTRMMVPPTVSYRSTHSLLFSVCGACVQKWELARDFSPDECAQFREVRRLVKPRVKKLIRVAEHFLDRIVNGVDSIPYGIRWICKQLRCAAYSRYVTVFSAHVQCVFRPRVTFHFAPFLL